MPLVSFVMAARNAEPWIGRALASISPSLADCDADYEVVLADGASSDATLPLAVANSRVRVVSRGDNGIYDGMNRAIAEARGQYVLLLNADDELIPSRAGRALKRLLGDRRFEMASCGAAFGATIERATLYRQTRRLSAQGILFGIPVVNARFFRRDLLERVGPFRTDLGLASDVEFMLRLLWANPHGLISEEPLYFYRSHADSQTISGDREGRLRNYRARAALTTSLLGSSAYDLARRELRAAYAVADAKHRLLTAKPVCSEAGLPRATRPVARDYLNGIRWSWAWRGVLSGG